MADGKEILKAVEDFLNRPMDPKVIERVRRFAGLAQDKGLVSSTKVFREEEEIDHNVVLMFFAPIGYRPLFDQEVVFLMSEGMQYESILKMPIYLRKELVNRKVKPTTRTPRLYETADMPPHMQKQMSAIRSMTDSSYTPG
jgi:hypothetical protein